MSLSLKEKPIRSAAAIALGAILVLTGCSDSEPPDGYENPWPLRTEMFLADNPETGKAELIRYDGIEVQWSHDIEMFGFENASAADPFHTLVALSNHGGERIVSVELIDTRESDDDELVATSAIGTFEWESGEPLWTQDEAMIFTSDIYIRSADDADDWMFVDESLLGLSDADRVFVGVDPLTREILWETPISDYGTGDPEFAVSGASEQFIVVSTGGEWKLIDRRDGTLIDPADDQIFGCQTRGEPMVLPLRSDPTQDPVEYISNRQSAGCTADGAISLAELSKTAVLTGSTQWTPAWAEHGSYDERYEESIRVISNETGIHAYRF